MRTYLEHQILQTRIYTKISNTNEEEEDLNEVPETPTFNAVVPLLLESYLDDEDANQVMMVIKL